MVEFECKTPATVAASLSDHICVQKTHQSVYRLVVLGFLAGAYIAFGAILATVVGSDASQYIGLGLTKLLMGIAFSVGLVLVVVAGAELFTGNNLILMSVLDKKIRFAELLKNWGIVYVANFVGSIFLVIIMYFSGLFEGGDIGNFALSMANAKVNLTFMQALIRGVGANWLVCLAVWLGLSSREIAGRILGIVLPIMAFVAIGFEHSIANMYFIPAGLFIKGVAGVDVTSLTWGSFIVKNLIPVTIGNIIGGAILVGLLYWSVYVRKGRIKEKN